MTLDIRGIAELTDRVTPVLRQIGAGMRRVAGEQMFSKLSAQAKVVSAAFGGVASAAGRVAMNVAAVGAIAGVAGAGIGAFAGYTVKAFADAGGGLADLAAKTGVGAEKLQELQYAAMLTGVEAESLGTGLTKLNKVLAEAQAGKNKQALEYFKRMGINIKGAKLEDVLPKIAEAFKKNGNDAQRTAAAMTLFGKAGAALIPMLIAGQKGLADTAAEARDLGLIISETDVAAADSLGDNFDKLSKAVRGLGIQIGAKLAPVIGPVIEDMLDWIKVNREWITTSIGDAVRDLIQWVREIDWKAATDSLKDFIAQGRDFLVMIGGWKTVLLAVTAILTGPLIVALATLGGELAKLIGIVLGVGGWPVILGLAVIAGAINNWDEFTGAIGRAVEGLRMIFQGNIMGGFAQIFQANIDVVKAVLKGFVALVGSLIGVDLVQKIADGADALASALDTYLMKPFRDAVAYIKALLDSIKLPDIFGSVGAPRGAPGNNSNTIPGNAPSTYGPGRGNPGFQPVQAPAAPQRTGALMDSTATSPTSQPGSLLRSATQAGVVAPAQRGEGTVTVRFANAPPGTQASTSSSGDLFKLRQGDMGFAMQGTG